MPESNAAERLAAALAAEIDTLPAGTRLLPTRTLQQRYSVSPVTVQRALSLLNARGTVETRPGQGSYTRRPTAAGHGRVTGTGDLGWQAAALAERPAGAEDVERLIAVPPPGVLALTSSFPDRSLQPAGLLAAAAARAARRDSGWVRPDPAGVPELRELFAAELEHVVRAEAITVTPGGQAALTVAFRALGRPGQPVLMESPTYLGALAAARAAGLVAVPVPVDDDGVRPDLLRTAFARTRSSVFYCQPRHANPTGATLAASRRGDVLAAVADARAFLIEDDWVRDLDLDRPTPPPLLVADPAGHIVHVRSLSKPVAAGLRIAGVAAAGPAAARIRQVAVSSALFVAPLLQHTAVEVLTSAGWRRHLSGLCRALRERRDTLWAALARELPDLPAPPRPRGGLTAWLRLHDHLDETAVTAALLARGVAVSPGRPFYPAEPDGPHLRLSYAAAPPHDLAAAVGQLALVLQQGRPPWRAG